MNMKRLYMLLTVLFVLTAVKAQGILPEFSTDENPVWYKVRFKTGGACLADQGSGKNLKTAAAANSDNQKWMLKGTRDGFTMKSKSGNYINFSNGRFTTSATPVELKIVQSTAAGADEYWEIQRKNSAQSMNQWGGAGAGKELGEWNAGDNNNPLTFLVTSIAPPEFSSEESETWYFLKFCRSGNTLADAGTGKNAVTAAADPIDTQMWKLMGTQDNFQLVSKSGNYAVVNGTGENTRIRTSATPSASGFKLAETGSSYAPAWEIHVNGKSGRVAFNQWASTQTGAEIGLWNANDNNNALNFVRPEDMIYPDYKVTGISNFVPENLLTLWYTQPATTTNAGNKWMEYSLPIGNGQFGASIFGGIYEDEIQFNEKTLWSGRNTDNGVEYGDYENFGSVFVENLSDEFGFGSTKAAKNYVRGLDLQNSKAFVSFSNPDETASYTREYIASYPDGVVAARYTGSESGSLNLRFTLVSGKPGIRATTTYAEGEATFSGKLETVSYNARFKVVPIGGTIETTEEGITVKGADEVLLILAGATDFDAYKSTYVSNTSGLAAKVQGMVDAAAGKTWNDLYNAHLLDYKNYFDRCNFHLEGAENTLPTDDLIRQYARRSTGTEPYALFLEQLYFAYGRYLEISSSRGVDLPSNLQGIWNNSSEPAWNGDIHANINVQMNYWPAEPTNLSEMHMPFLNYITNMATNHNEWKKYAKDAGQTRGWTCYTENNIFGGVGSFLHSYVIANAWYCTHLWQHYRYTLDKEFLKNAFPTMLSASQFWMDRLRLDKDGTYVCPNEYSPEHGPTENGVAHAQQLVYELFDNTLKAIEILGEDAVISEADLTKLNDRFNKLDRGLATETYTGQWGASVNGIKTGTTILREWKTSNYTVGQNGHRHMSHLMCIYPFSQVTAGSKYFDAAVNSMKLRGDASTGWSMGWKINLWARVLDGNHAHDILELALRHHSVGGGGVYYNLYDAHTPFQIDGNFGACAGIAEMLMQSHTDTIQILPALPDVWKKGSINGLKAIGDFTVDIAWSESKAQKVTITSNLGQPCFVQCPGIATRKFCINGKEVGVTAISEDVVNIPLEKGQTVEVFMEELGTGIAKANSDKAAVLSLEGRKVRIEGADVKSIVVCDPAGRKVLKTNRATFKVPESCGPVALLQVCDKSGKKTSYKAVLK